MNRIIRIMLANTLRARQAKLKALLSAEIGIRIVGNTLGGMSAARMAQKLRPQVAIVGVSMPSSNDIETIRLIANQVPGIKIIAVSTHTDTKDAAVILSVGASGYLLKGDEYENLLSAIQIVLRGETFVSRKIRVRNWIKKGDIHPPR
jgi:two-component system, NarL family, response regulator NreC